MKAVTKKKKTIISPEAEKCIAIINKRRLVVKKEPKMSKVKKMGEFTITGPGSKNEFLKSMAFQDLDSNEEMKCFNRNCAFALEVLSLPKEQIKIIKKEVDQDFSVLNKIHEGNNYLNKKTQEVLNGDLYWKLHDPKDYYSDEVLESLKK